MTPLYAEMHRWAATPYLLGVSDCGLVIFDWVRAARGCADPGEDIRGLYDDWSSLQRLTGWLRDPVAAFAARLERVGCRRVQRPEPGDVAVVIQRADPRRVPHGALWLGTCWGLKGASGATTVHPGQVEVLAVWSVGYAA